MELTHLNEQGRGRMVDVSDKADTVRTAMACGFVSMAPATAQLIRDGGIAKGDVLAVAQVAGIMAAKNTSNMIPMCHPLPLTAVDIHFEVKENGVAIRAIAKCTGKTGVEMEALTAISVAALTIYDMCKAVQKDMVIEQVCLLEKTGGKSGIYRREEQ